MRERIQAERGEHNIRNVTGNGVAKDILLVDFDGEIRQPVLW
jgi:hypothetical protein